MPKCCYYEKGTEKKHVCTTDGNCPTLIGWTLIGSWNVDKCANCYNSAETQTAIAFDEGPGDGREVPEVQWQTITRKKLLKALPRTGRLWLAKSQTTADCHAVQNIVICAGSCPKGQQCRPDPNNFVDCLCQ